MLDLESALNKLQSLEDRGISSYNVDLPSDEFVLYLVCKSLEQQCACDHKGFDFLIIDSLEEEPFDDVLFNVKLNKTRKQANSKIIVSCLRDGIKKREKIFTVGLDSFDTAESIIKWICRETSPENLSLLENRNIIKSKRSRKLESSDNKMREFMNINNELIQVMRDACDKVDDFSTLCRSLGDLIPSKTREEVEYICGNILSLERMLRDLRY